MSKSAKRLQVYSLKTTNKGTIWIKAGSAWINRDGSINVYLDVLPLDGKLHIRESLETPKPSDLEPEEPKPDNNG